VLGGSQQPCWVVFLKNEDIQQEKD
jgi:hypothetical protein